MLFGSTLELETAVSTVQHFGVQTFHFLMVTATFWLFEVFIQGWCENVLTVSFGLLFLLVWLLFRISARVSSGLVSKDVFRIRIWFRGCLGLISDPLGLVYDLFRLKIYVGLVEDLFTLV